MQCASGEAFCSGGGRGKGDLPPPGHIPARADGRRKGEKFPFLVHCSRGTFPPKGKARASETIEKLDLTVERRGSRRCTFAAANYTPSSSSLISFLSRRRFPELHSELLFNQGSGVRCFLLPTIGFPVLFAPGFECGPIFDLIHFECTPERIVVEDLLKVSLERSSPVFFKTLSLPFATFFQKSFFLVPPSPSYNGPRHKGTFQWTSPSSSCPVFFCLSASCVPIFSPLPLEEQGRVKKVLLLLLPPAFCSCSLSPIRYVSSSKKIHTNEANFDRIF